ncbi:heterokaryon incompatibility protein-domain-containing protein [Lenzites betulinus]|nr:heterokaryon incompatibility protein-domain-containing protein [Lenzites betulinus]
MPRFLNTYTGEFVWIADVGATPYAILSHTWRSDKEGGEQTYDDIVKLQTKCPTANPKPWNDDRPPRFNKKFFSHPKLSEKIKRACEVARKAGFRLIWIDSCCIDKRSSAELSEAINSMYALYRDADVCYVYLADVPRGTDPRAKDSEFWKSRWHKRGWTLQELVAPPYVVFLTSDWTFLGTKTGLASTLEKVTGVDAGILLGVERVESASVAKRMSWAAERETTRVEDRAYSLLGIFGVHMSPIYGEGTNAFLRLQEEIIKHIPDQSIFAWGWSRTLLALGEVADEYRGGWVASASGLLAASPDAFGDVGDVAPITVSEFAMRIGDAQNLVLPPLHCVFTPQGARMELLTIPLPPETSDMLADENAVSCDDCRVANARSPFRRLALLRCTDRDGHLIGLPLRCPEEDVGAAENVVIGVHACCVKELEWHESRRVVRLSASVLKDLDVAPTCVQVSLLRHWKEPVEPKARRDGFSKIGIRAVDVWQDGGNAPEIQLAPHCEEELRSVRYTLTPLDSELRQPEDTRPAELVFTTTLHMHSTTQKPPHNDQHMHPPILIELELQRSELYHSIPCHLSVDLLHPPSAIELVHPASPAPDSVSSAPPLHDESHHTPPTAGNPHRQSNSFDISRFSTSRTIAEAEFVIPDCAVSRTDADGVSMDYVRLLRLKLEQPIESAYIEDSDHLSFSVELSEPFIRNTAPTDAQAEPAATSTGFAQSERLADSSLIQAAAEPSPDPEVMPSSRPSYNATPEPAPSPTTRSEQKAVSEGPGSPGPCDAVMHDGPNVGHVDGTPGTVPSPPHDTAQDAPGSTMCPTAASRQTAAREASPVHDAGSAGRSAFAEHPSEYPPADVARLDAAGAQGVSADPSTDSGGTVQKALRNVRQFLKPLPQRPRRWILRDNSSQRPP